MYIFVPVSFDSVCQGVRCWGRGVSLRCSEERENAADGVVVVVPE